MVELIRYFYPSQIVHANPSHVSGEESSTAVEVTINHGLIENHPDQLAIDVTLLLDKEQSKNYPYDFQLKIFGTFNVSQDEKLSLNKQAMMGTQLLIGCLRERLSLLTQAGPWPMVTLSMQTIGHLFTESESDIVD